MLISVSDKKGVVEFAKALRELGIEIISTGGTAKVLHTNGIAVKTISEVTNFPEIFDGRLKTLHPKIHGALLGITDNPTHLEEMEKLGIEPIDMVVVNLYPFEETINRTNISLEEAIEQIDIGGPAMLRSAAKNFRYKAVVINPNRYQSLIQELSENDGALSDRTRFALAKEVFQHTSHYDTVISNYFERLDGKVGEKFPANLSLLFSKSENLRYGENPHQAAALYGSFNSYFRKLHGKELSFNNTVDINAAAFLIAEFDAPTVAIVKHTNPCGVGSDASLLKAYQKALATDTRSRFGGIVAVNRPLDMETAQVINEIFTEVIIAPDFPEAVSEFLKKKKDRRLIRQMADLRLLNELDIRKVAGGLLVQEPDKAHITKQQLKVVTKRKPSDEEFEAMLFAWKVVKHVKSNAIVYARNDRTVGIGAGQMSRVDASKLAVWKAKEAGLDLAGTAVASDAFLPFADGLLEAVRSGATAVIQPGGSVRDEEVIKAADEHNVAMAFTDIRHFKH